VEDEHPAAGIAAAGLDELVIRNHGQVIPHSTGRRETWHTGGVTLAPPQHPAFDLIQPFSVRWYNQRVPAHPLPEFARADALGWLLASSRGFWAPFIAARRADPALRAAAHPVERYVERVCAELAALLPVRATVRFAHDGGPRLVAMQQLAEVSGLAALSPSHLSVHPRFGPWIALRAVIVCDADGPSGAPPAVASACDCAANCMPALERAMAAGEASCEGVAEAWRQWVAVREACPVGREHRYSDAQIRYHYTKDRGALE